MSTSQTTITSIIHEYEVLYTSRLTQKSKNWNDGKLKFYEFNRKIEIHNEDGNLIASDFYKTKPIESILTKLLCDDNEFKLPNANFLVQIQGKLRDFEREVNLRVKSDDSQGSQKTGSLGIKRRMTQDPFSMAVSKPAVSMQTPKRRVVNARTLVIKDVPPPQPVKRPVHSTPKVVKVINENSAKPVNEAVVRPVAKRSIGLPRTSTPAASKLQAKRLALSSRSANKPSAAKLKKSQVSKIVPRSLIEQVDCRIAKRSSIRILPRTATHYQHLYTRTSQIDSYQFREPNAGNLVASEVPAVKSANNKQDEPVKEIHLGEPRPTIVEPLTENLAMHEIDEEDDYRIRIVEDDEDDEVVEDEIEEQEDPEPLNYEADHDASQEDVDYEPLNSSSEISEPVQPSQLKAIERKSTTKLKELPNSSDSEFVIADSPDVHDVHLKQEKPFNISNKTVNDADMIYDLSEMEQDEKFDAMLEEMRKCQLALGDITNRRTKASKDYNVSAEFDLSTDSELEEI
ncbi:hypothetical protein Cantr_02805 [Candida viswanathii]|uniref:5'-3' DNA helicase ZGRF1-like N-terminal domain-containing protein n=1 Tax=Candida viswanathii TaxID=5486 RepID=A0A367YP23_9ASCO|nr:hypothetical protein Cantr_02805 [Candida viswanathii]